MNTVEYDAMLKREARAEGLTVQELCRRRCDFKRLLRFHGETFDNQAPTAYLRGLAASSDYVLDYIDDEVKRQ